MRRNPKTAFDYKTMSSVSSGKSTTDDLDSIQVVACFVYLLSNLCSFVLREVRCESPLPKLIIPLILVASPHPKVAPRKFHRRILLTVNI